ncbi:MAG TPA: hypothetical protein ENJ95_11240 [Bacteroidetes bacterium]|nr:hypothetical protein [Bacteroidota bacterium]
MKRLKAKKVATMNLVNKVTKEKYYFERKDNGSGAYLFSHSMSKEIGTMHGGGAAVTFSGDTIFGKYIQFPSMIVPIKGMGGKENQVAAFWYNDDEGYHFLERKTTSSGQAVFLEKITGGKLSHYQKLNKVYVGPGEGKVNGKTTKVYGWVTVRTDYVCKEGIGCDKIPSLGFKKFMQPYIKDCDIYLPAYRRSYFKALIKDYNKRCGEAADQKNKKK